MQHFRMIFHFSISECDNCGIPCDRKSRKINVMTQANRVLTCYASTGNVTPLKCSVAQCTVYSLFLLPLDISKAETVNCRHGFNCCNNDASLQAYMLAVHGFTPDEREKLNHQRNWISVSFSSQSGRMKCAIRYNASKRLLDPNEFRCNATDAFRITRNLASIVIIVIVNEKMLGKLFRINDCIRKCIPICAI